MDDGNNKGFIEQVETFNPRPIINRLQNEDNEEILFNSSTLVEKRILYSLVDGGSPIVSLNHDNDTRMCSAGFWMRNNNQDVILTAGHCPEIFPTLFYVHSFQDDYLIGPMDARVIRLYDMGFIRRTNPNILFRPVIRQLIREISQFVEFLIVGSSEITSCGTHICKAGQSTGITCGLVSAFNSVGFFDRQQQQILMVRTIIVPMNNAAGDSGGSMFRYNGHNNQSHFADAVGIYIGGIFGRLAIGMPMSVAYELGYSLITTQY
ncbi:S1 family peptidase [Gigaspora margarita]|uniref:S1 family peptidase n=1 Tax=Gigaspora margarita TaxID=4874 RepID=A0A8H3XG03_GIGMA|nr:S1 family peptidase [Gigaspora margarita]